MRYKDKTTLKQVSNHQSKCDYTIMSNRQKERQRQRWLSDFRLKIKDKIWWDSLSDNDKTEVAHSFMQYKDGMNNLKDLIKQYPGNKVYIREAKLNLLIDGSRS